MIHHHNTVLPEIVSPETKTPVALTHRKIARLLSVVHQATANPAMTPLLLALITRCQDRKERPEDALMALLKEKK